MISDRDLVLAAAATYDKTNKPYYSSFNSAIDVYLTYQDDGTTVIAIEGTHDPLGWALDFLAIRTLDHEGINHPSLGWLHKGFYDAAQSILPTIALAVNNKQYAICGHSLGAALALLIGGLLIDDGQKPIKIGAFAPPKVGSDDFLKVISSVPYCAYRYGNDPVPTVPFYLPLFPYKQVALKQIGTANIDAFSCHHIDNYVDEIK